MALLVDRYRYIDIHIVSQMNRQIPDSPSEGPALLVVDVDVEADGQANRFYVAVLARCNQYTINRALFGPSIMFARLFATFNSYYSIE